MKGQQARKFITLYDFIMLIRNQCYDEKGLWVGTVNLPDFKQDVQGLMLAAADYLREVE